MRLIDADALANDLLSDVEMDARALDNTDLVGKERELIQFDKDCKQNCVYYLTTSETIDAVPVIRCKDCKYARLTDEGEVKYCDIWFPDEEEYIDGDSFCSQAERREE